jgi:hypothetical protein
VGAVGDGSGSVCKGKTAVVTGSVFNMVTMEGFLQGDDSRMKQDLKRVYRRKKKRKGKGRKRPGGGEVQSHVTHGLIFLLTLSEGLICRFTKGY